MNCVFPQRAPMSRPCSSTNPLPSSSPSGVCLTGPHLPAGRRCCRCSENLAVVVVHTETHFLAWVPTGRASSGTGEAKWSGSPFEAQSLTAANLHHLEQQRKKQPMYIKTWHPSKGTTSVRFTHRDEQRPALGAGRATFHHAACSPALAGKLSHHSLHMCHHLPSPALPLKAAIFELALGPSLPLQSYSSPHTPAAAPLSFCWGADHVLVEEQLCLAEVLKAEPSFLASSKGIC